jgi:hypothetical protein
VNPVRRLKPYLLLAVLILGTGLGTGLGLSEAPAASALPPGVAVHLELDRTRIITGHSLTGWLVFENGSNSLKIGSRRDCRPSPVVIITNRHYVPPVLAGYCSTGAFTIPHGVTRWRFEVVTYFTECVPAGEVRSSSASIPHCLSPGPNGAMRFPDLPVGRYLAKGAMGTRVPGSSTSSGASHAHERT